MNNYTLAASVAIISIVGTGMLAHHSTSSWIPTSSGAVQANSFDFITSGIGIHNGYKQDGVCKDYVNELSSESNTGVGAAVEDSSYYAKLDYYYYKTESFISFHKNGTVAFTLTLSESPTYLRVPRIVPDKQAILDKLQNLSMANQLDMTKALNDERGKPKQFTAGELAALVERIAGKQSFDLTAWVVENFYDQDEQKFMTCVPNIEKLVENYYGPEQQRKMLDQLTGAESSLHSTQRKLVASGILGIF